MKTVNKNFELQGMTTSRTVKDFLFWKLLPVGNLAEGPGIVWLISAMLRHKFGYQLAVMQLADGPTYRRFASFVGHIKRLARRG